MEYKIKDITECRLDGKIVWITDFRYNDYGKRPIRHIKPTKALVCNNTETDKKIYYSGSHFVKLNEEDEPLRSKVIPLYDHTGFRVRTGTALTVFDDEEECIEYYMKQCEKHKKGLRRHQRDVINMVSLKIQEIDDIIEEYNII